MSGELDLFNFDAPDQSYACRLKAAMSAGKRFFSISETARIFRISEYRVRCLVLLYRLDAFLIGGVYRIPWTGIAVFPAEMPEIRRQFFDYIAFVEGREIPKFWKIRKRMSMGRVDEARGLVNGRFVSDAVLAEIADRTLPTPSMLDTEEKDPEDWYGIGDMGLPEAAKAWEWEKAIGVRTGTMQMGCANVVGYPEVYDYLVDHEVENLPAESQQLPDDKEEENAGKQLELF